MIGDLIPSSRKLKRCKVIIMSMFEHRCLGFSIFAIWLGASLFLPAYCTDDAQANSQASYSAPARLQPKITWQDFTDDLFVRAKREGRHVLLDLEAVWCHWCHVMDKETYKDPAVVKLINSSFIPVKVDQDSRPDLSNKYEAYGWPATVVFGPNGSEKAIWSGYIPPAEMKNKLQFLLDHKSTPLKVEQIEFSQSAALSGKLRDELVKKHIDGYDTKHGAWSFAQKFLDWDSVEYAMDRGRSKDVASERRARETLTAQRKLIDPVWGGVYQYSTHGDWNHPHFEKIMQMQAENLRIYSLGYMQWQDPTYLKAARDIERYLRAFLLSPEGAFYTSQDADLIPGKHSSEYFSLNDAERRKKGIPRVDKHIYARENGWAINALAYLYMATADDHYRKEAIQSADWVIANRSLPDGGYRHDSQDKSGPYLGDSLAMGRAFLSLYTATADKKWLSLAENAARFIGKHFAEAQGPGFATADLLRQSFQKPKPLLDENVMLTRFANLLFHYSGDKQFKKMAEQAMRYLSTPAIARTREMFVAGILLADAEINSDPPHVTVVGSKNDAVAFDLFVAANKYPGTYKRIEWWDPSEGPLPNMDVEYPQLKDAAAFICVNGRCSSPIYKPEAIAARLEVKSRSSL